MSCDISPEILCGNVSVKHNDILFELLLYLYNHNTSEFNLRQATGNYRVKKSIIKPKNKNKFTPDRLFL